MSPFRGAKLLSCTIFVQLEVLACMYYGVDKRLDKFRGTSRRFSKLCLFSQNDLHGKVEAWESKHA